MNGRAGSRAGCSQNRLRGGVNRVRAGKVRSHTRDVRRLPFTNVRFPFGNADGRSAGPIGARTVLAP